MHAEKQIMVAVAEDEAYLQRDICRSIQESQGLHLVGAAASGAGIVELALNQTVDVILMDIEMERHDSGIQAAIQIAEKKPQTIIIFLTVHEEDEIIYQAFSVAPNVDYIVKSADAERVMRKIHEAYEGRNRISPQIMRKLTGEFGRMRRNQSNIRQFVNILFSITPREKELIKMLLENHTIAQIAAKRCVEVVTVKSQINTMLKKFKMKRTKEVISYIRMLDLEELFD